jgi:hypothetical protein
MGGKSEMKRYRIGDPVRVQLVKVLEEKRQLDFRLAEEDGGSVVAPNVTPREKTRPRVAGRPRKERPRKQRSR